MKAKRKGKHFVYIVQCSNNTYYTGYTPDIEKRLRLHNAGKGAKYTRDRRPVKLVWCKEYRYFKPAFITEKRIKNLTRKQKEALVSGKRLDKVLMEAGKWVRTWHPKVLLMKKNNREQENLSGRQECGVNSALRNLPHGGSDMTSKCQRVYIRTFGWPLVCSLQVG